MNLTVVVCSWFSKSEVETSNVPLCINYPRAIMMLMLTSSARGEDGTSDPIGPQHDIRKAKPVCSVQCAVISSRGSVEFERSRVPSFVKRYIAEA